MITNKDIRVENGSLILNGDPYPLDGQSPEEIMQIVEDNSDSTPTENSDAPVKSGGVYAAIDEKIKYKDVIVNVSSSGHGTPTRSAAGAYYEPLADYTALGVTRDKILSLNLIDWISITKSFSLYIGSSAISALTDSETSIYANDPFSKITLRVAYKN